MGNDSVAYCYCTMHGQEVPVTVRLININLPQVLVAWCPTNKCPVITSKLLMGNDSAAYAQTLTAQFLLNTEL